MQILTDTSALDKEFAARQSECDVSTELIRKCVEENAHSALNQDEYQKRYDALFARYEAAKKRLEEILDEKQTRAAKHECISRFISDLEQCGGLLAEFDEELWYETVETVTVHSESDVVVTFKDGSEISVNLQEGQK